MASNNILNFNDQMLQSLITKENDRFIPYRHPNHNSRSEMSLFHTNSQDSCYSTVIRKNLFGEVNQKNKQIWEHQRTAFEVVVQNGKK